jgi:hypothetical protein
MQRSFHLSQQELWVEQGLVMLKEVPTLSAHPLCQCDRKALLFIHWNALIINVFTKRQPVPIEHHGVPYKSILL